MKEEAGLLRAERGPSTEKNIPRNRGEIRAPDPPMGFATPSAGGEPGWPHLGGSAQVTSLRGPKGGVPIAERGRKVSETFGTPSAVSGSFGETSENFGSFREVSGNFWKLW